MESHSSDLRVNYAFCLHMAAHIRAGGRVLDYGCGAAQTVSAGLARGMDVYGTDVFYEGGQATRAVKDSLLSDRVREMQDGRIPFPDQFFDFVFHNQVFEHVFDIDRALSEIRRVLRPNGVMLSIFPSGEVMLEGHVRMPFAHRLRGENRVRWIRFLRGLGVGTNIREDPTANPDTYARFWADWIDRWCCYRSREDLIAAYARHGFSFEPHELDYIHFRLSYTGKGRFAPLFNRAAVPLFRRVAGIVVISSPPSASS